MPSSTNGGKHGANSVEEAETIARADALHEHVKGYDAWDREEIDAWSPDECNALFIQLISGDLREAGLDDCETDEFDWQGYEERQAAGTVNSNLYRGVDNEIYYYLGT